MRLLPVFASVSFLMPAVVGGANPPARETFSVTYTIEVDGAKPARARVRWALAGIDEIERIRLRFDPERFEAFTGSGVLKEQRGEIRWFPSGPYAELEYVAHVDHRRAPDKGYDSYAGDGWILSRTTAFFPRSGALFRHEVEPSPESRARLVFRLPRGWESVTVFPSDAPDSYLVETPHRRFDHPRGWLLLGRTNRVDTTIDNTALTIARAPGVTHKVDRTMQLLSKALPPMLAIFQRPLPRLLVVLGPDPMWRGGLSGEESFYMHGDRPLRSRDHTSPYLHELFHVAAPFRPAPDAHWVTEGLAEYYSIELARRDGSLPEKTYRRALDLFADHGVWGHDFTRNASPALRNNSAPLVMWALDRRIRTATKDVHGLDDVVTALAADGGTVSTGRFLGTVRRVAGRSFASFFRRHVYRGERPLLPEASAP
ncbi:MAG: hypothetical protein IT293_21685 [Deltaproteobacteria bacterium]|nr:hypothetical protein [Deltaproteobacteria bacterium]